MYPDPAVSSLIGERFIPVRAHVRQQPEAFQQLGKRYDAHWTPTILVLDSTGAERHRIEGFLPVDDFLAQLRLGLGHSAFAQGRFDEAGREFGAVETHHPDSDAAAEALYWAGVSRYKRSGDAAALRETARAFRERYTTSPWAKKASVWAE